MITITGYLHPIIVTKAPPMQYPYTHNLPKLLYTPTPAPLLLPSLHPPPNSGCPRTHPLLPLNNLQHHLPPLPLAHPPLHHALDHRLNLHLQPVLHPRGRFHNPLIQRSFLPFRQRATGE